jgi:negative regulator of flagellin synthesis FlgM
MNPIDNINIRPQRSDTDQVGRRSGDVESGARTDTAVSDNGPVGESVSFTSTAAELLSLENQLRELPGVDQQRVDDIRQAISNGSYEIDAGRIVDSLLMSENELG